MEPLELVGTDRPYKSAAGVNPPLQLNTPQVRQQQAVNSQTQQQAIAKAGQQMAQPLVTASETVQLRTQQELDAIQAQQRSDLRKNMADAQKAASDGDAISALAQTAAQYLLQRQQMDENKKLEAKLIAEEQAKKAQENINEQTKQRVYNMLQEAEKEGYAKSENGTTGYKTRLQLVLSQSGADEETKTQLTKEFMVSATAYDKQVNDRLYADAREAKDKITETAKAQLKFELTGSMTELRENKFVNGDKAKTQFSEQMAKIQSRTDLAQSQKDELTATAYTMFADALEGNTAARAKVADVYESYQKYREQEQKVNEKVANGELTQSAANAQLANLRAFYGVSAADAYDPYADLEKAKKVRELTEVPETEMTRINEQVDQVVESKYRIDEGSLGAAAYGLVKQNGGAGLADLRSKPKSELTSTEQKLLNRAELIEKALEQQTTLQRKEAEYKQAIAKFNQGSLEDAIRLAGKGKSSGDAFEQAAIARLLEGMTEEQKQAYLKSAGGQPLSDEDKANLETARKEVVAAITEEANINQQKLLDVRDDLASFGITGDPEKDGEWLRKGQESFNKTLKLQTEERNKLLNDALLYRNGQAQPGIQNPNAGGGGGQSRFPKDVTIKRTRTDLPQADSLAVDNLGVLAPFSAKLKDAPVTSVWSAPRPGGRKHAGIDYGVAIGTPLHNLTDGVVVKVEDEGGDKGYGQYVTIKGADGMYYRYAHLQRGSVLVQEGDAVPAGAKFASTGDSGRGSGGHLHFEIRSNDGYGFEGSVEPHAYLSNSASKKTRLSPARNNQGKVDDVDETDVDSDTQTFKMPQGAVPLASGGFIFNGQVFAGNGKPSKATFNGAKRMNNSYVTELKAGQKVTNALNANYGYKELADNPEFAKALNQTSNELNIPAQWLADVMAMESSFRGTAQHDITKATGLIQFTPATAKLMGTSIEAIAKMTPAQQMRTVVKKYIQAGQKEVGGLRSGAELYAYIYGGGAAVRAIRKDPNAANRINDGQSTLASQLNKMGASKGRQYALGGQARLNRIAKATHTTYHDGCAVCENFRQSKSAIVPHEPQMNAPLAGSKEWTKQLPQVPKG